ncbi:hypothetical protein HDU89_000497 [Geranomyces variabilis]|nr:hypothetical protein HDU89_000497 [Geranomyces variabilis]
MLAASATINEVPEHSAAEAKIALIGNEAVGKTALVRVLLGLSFPTTHSATFEDKFRWPAAPTPLVIFDMAGAAAYDRLRPFSYPGIPAFLICFAVDERRSFRDVEDKWVPELQYYVPGVRIHLAALKTDLRDDSETAARMLGNAEEAVSEDEGREMAARIGADGYSECSALKDEGVRELIEEVLRRETAPTQKLPLDGSQELSPDPQTASEASDSADAPNPGVVRAAATGSPGVELKAGTVPNVTRKPSLTTSRVNASKTRPSPSPSAPARRPSTTSLSRRTSVSILRTPDAIPTPPTTPKLSHIEISVARRPSVSKGSPKVPSSPQLTNSPTSSIPSSARQGTSTAAQITSGYPTAGVTRRPSTSRLAASGSPSPTTVTRRPSLGTVRLTPDAAASPTTARRTAIAATPVGEHRRGSLPHLVVKTTTIASPAVHAIKSTPGSATASNTAAPAAEPVIMPIRRNGVTSPASTTPSGVAAKTSTLRASPSTTRLAATVSSAASKTAAAKKPLPETPTTPTVRKRNSISSLWKRDAAGGAVAAGPTPADHQPQEPQKQQQRPVLRSASVRSTAKTPAATTIAPAAAPKPVPRVAQQPSSQPSQQRPDTLSGTVTPTKGKEKEKKLPVWERLAGLAKKKVDKQPSAATTAATAGSAHRSWH